MGWGGVDRMGGEGLIGVEGWAGGEEGDRDGDGSGVEWEREE